MEKTLIIKFSAPWCGPCKTLNRDIKKLVEEFPNVVVRDIDVDDNPDEAKKYSIRQLPTVIFIKDGQEIDRVNGLTKIAFLRKMFSKLSEENKAA